MDSESKLFSVGTLVCILDNTDLTHGSENPYGIKSGEVLPIRRTASLSSTYIYQVYAKDGHEWWLGVNQVALPESLSKLDRAYYGIQEEG